MKFYNKDRFTHVLVNGKYIDKLKISETFHCELLGDSVKVSTDIEWHHPLSPYRCIIVVYSDIDDINGFQINLTDIYKNSVLMTRTDLFVYDINGNQLNHWIKPSEEFWVKMPLKKGDNIICVYYGSGIKNLGDGNQVFEFFDDFSGNSLDSNKWEVHKELNVDVSNSILTISGKNKSSTWVSLRSKYSFNGNIIVGCKAKIYKPGKLPHPLMVLSDPFVYRYGFIVRGSNYEVVIQYHTPTDHWKTTPSLCYIDSKWYLFTITKENNTLTAHILNKSFTHEHSVYQQYPCKVFSQVRKDDTDGISYDYIYVGKYTYPEPIAVLYKQESR